MNIASTAVDQLPSSPDRSLTTDLHVEATQRLVEALVESDNRMSRRVELLGDAVFETDSHGKLVFMNSAWTPLIGLAIEDCLGQPVIDYVAPDSREHAAGLLSAECGSPGNALTRFTHRDGRDVWVLLTTAPIAVGGVVGVLHDFTSEKAAQDQLSMLSIVASSTDSLVVITDAHGRAEWVNPAFERRTGWTLQEVVGRTPGSFLQGPATDRATVERLRCALRERRSIREEILNYTKAGDPYWVALHITPVNDDGGRLERFIAVQTDTTERKRYEREILDHQTLLESRVMIRTAALARAKEEAEEAVRATIAFTAELTRAHDSLKEAQGQRRGLLDRMRALSGRLGSHNQASISGKVKVWRWVDSVRFPVASDPTVLERSRSMPTRA